MRLIAWLSSSILTAHSSTAFINMYWPGIRRSKRWACRRGCGAFIAALEVRPEVPIITRNEVERAKPDPDLFLAAAQRVNVPISHAMVVGDSVRDLLAARRAGCLGTGLLSGGYGREELQQVGAYRVYQDPADLLANLDEVGIRISDRMGERQRVEED